MNTVVHFRSLMHISLRVDQGELEREGLLLAQDHVISLDSQSVVDAQYCMIIIDHH